MIIGNKEFDTKENTYIMGILNVTPDSFSDGGKFNDRDKALFHAKKMAEEGADILDVGGESTRPGHDRISEEEETERCVPIIELLKQEFDLPVSIDTYKTKVAKAALTAGADLVNDIWGLQHEEGMAGLIADSGAACCLMHNRPSINNLIEGKKKAEYHNSIEANVKYDMNRFTEIIKRDLQESVRIAKAAGIQTDKIILDPGVGFGKTYEQNLETICCLEQLHSLGYPLLLGASRKSVIGLSLDLPVSERLEGTLVTTVLAVMKRCAFVRVHDVKENARAIRMAKAIRDGWRQQ